MELPPRTQELIAQSTAGEEDPIEINAHRYTLRKKNKIAGCHPPGHGFKKPRANETGATHQESIKKNPA